MTYVMTGLHGDLARYEAMLCEIKFSKKDVLFLLGDVVDYGEDAAELLVKISMCENVYPIAGEHDFLALRMLTGFERILSEGGAPDPDFAAEMTAWAMDGGNATLTGYRALDKDMREGVLDYLSEFSLYEEIEVGGKSYLLVHAGVNGFSPDKELEDYKPEDFFEVSAGQKYDIDSTVVVGHAPTASGRIEREGNLVRLGCGLKESATLACLCLETGEEFYI